MVQCARGEKKRPGQEVRHEASCSVFLFLVSAIAVRPRQRWRRTIPNKPIHVLTTSSAGGISDIFMRVLGEELHKSLGQPIIIENRPGGAGNIATRACTEAAPDGYTICIINADPLIYNQYLFKNLPFDPEKVTPIINLFHLIQVLVINSDLKAKTVDQLIATSREKPGTLSYLTASIPCVVYMDSLKNEKGADWVRVPFKGGGEATNAILGGSTPIGLLGLGNVISQHPRRQDDGAGAGQQHPHAASAGDADARRSRLQGRAVADLVRAVRARRARRSRSSTRSRAR